MQDPSTTLISFRFYTSLSKIPLKEPVGFGNMGGEAVIYNFSLHY
jgi:hypothetical protein